MQSYSVTEKGFTLLEFVMIIIILSILAAVVYPKFSAVSEIRLNSAADKLKSDLYYAQELAATTHTRCGIYINNAGTYTIYENGNTADPALDPAKFADYVVTLDAGITIATTATGLKIEFDNVGVPYDSSGALAVERIITLNGTLSVKVAPETGWIHL